MKAKSKLTTAAGILLLAVFALYEASLSPDREILVDDGAARIGAEVKADNDLLTPMPSPSSSHSAMPVIISDNRIEHILYGDENGKGGGHLYGTGAPCKSEFPENWDADKVINVTRKIAANDNLPWTRQGNGYYVTEAFEDNVRVRVVKGPQKQRVITAYPTNVKRNPCPANDN